MALYVNTNISSLNAQRQLMNSGNTLDTAFQRLSSGLRINSAKDDAAGLQISDRLTSQINGLEQGNRNANDGISLAQTAEGALDEMTGMYQRIRTLAAQAANGSNTQSDRAALQLEARQLGEEMNRIAADTTFGGTNLLDGSYSAEFQVGADANQTISMTMTAIEAATGGAISVNSFAVSDLAAAASNVSGVSAGADTAFASASGLSFTSVGEAQDVLAAVDAMIGAIDAKRAQLGAVQNRFSSTIRNQTNIIENVSAARSRIKDADFATETATLTKAQILQQASSTILSQANQRPQSALSLLG
ncbi:flagellin [Pseudoalteromonas sp. A25]|uniref:flagellin N-terminal helical domain-containing protein n=1 Tax=Pseudoalteromonas sp. A25 TaxID=116092 RepID=UPI001260FE49|nr:flagellin [Pseudoalteromonas sp. A25]BBN81075.1 flagellin [Pseudoalteromonas sp. A25]BBN81077.1 flagellin [Pseudoalteromonas sp. A25]BBN81079.1 flagellin [Pseudoalteromonas sp. A25]BBN81081.1 flagellin [Pseudoalteromonas sp. A25]